MKNILTVAVKDYRHMLYLLGGVMLVMTIVLIIVICQSGYKGKKVAKDYAKEALRTVAEQAINEEYEKLNIPYFSSYKGKIADVKHRWVTTEKGKFMVDVDSLKESQALYSLEEIGSKFTFLILYEIPLFDKILATWKEEVDVEYNNAKCALRLKITPLGDSTSQENTYGDATICVSQHFLGTYYMDNVYTTLLSAYFVPPTIWQCINWKSLQILLSFGIWGMSLLVLSFLILLKRRRESLNVTHPIYTIGMYSFDVIRQVLIYKGQEQSCSPQASKLLHAFIMAPDCFLTNDEICHICGWSMGDEGLESRRRAAMKLLRKCFLEDLTIKIVSLTEKGGYQLIVSGE